MNEALFWDWSNLRSMTASCHSRKTATEDGGFGHRRKS
jgi:5-methylcytosine-specific restriction protein A